MGGKDKRHRWIAMFGAIALMLPILAFVPTRARGSVQGKTGIEWDWAFETIDPSPGIGTYASLRLFPSDRQAAVAYYDVTQQDLKYAYHDGEGWSVETVDFPGDVGQYASLALSSSGFPRIAYYDATNGNLKYVRKDAEGWHIEVVDAVGDVGRHASLALFGGTFPHIAYYDAGEETLRYAWNDGIMWYKETVEPILFGDAGQYASLAISSSGLPHIAYYDATNGDLKHAWKDAEGKWLVEIVDDAGDVGRYASLALDSSDLPHIAYYDASNFDLKYAFYDGTTWQIEVVDGTDSVGRYASLALDSSDLPHIAYYDASNHSLRYAHHDGTSWHLQTVHPHSTSASLFLDTQDRPHIAFRDDAEEILKWAYFCWMPEASFEVSPTPYCVGNTLVMTNTTVSTWTVSYLWSFGDGVISTLKNPTHAYTEAGLYPVVLTATSGCGVDAFSRTLPVWDAPVASYERSAPACVNLPIVFTSTSQVSGTAFYLWDWGDKTGVVTGTPAPTHIYTATGTYPVTFQVWNECGFDTAGEWLTVYDVPTASFEHGPNPSCGTVAFTSTSSGAEAFLWDFGDGITSTISNPVHLYTTGGFYTVTLTVWGEGGCADMASSVQEVWTGVYSAGVNLFPAPPVVGEMVTFTARAEGTPPITFTWDLGDGGSGSGAVVTHTYAAAGTYLVRLTATNACGVSLAQAEVTPCVAPAGLAMAYAPRPLSPGQIGTFTATLSAGNAPLHYLWSFGDGTPPAEGSVVRHTYTVTGHYTATLSVWNDCGSLQGMLSIEVLAPHFQVYLPLVARNLHLGDIYEPDDTPEQARALLLGQPQQHSFDPEGDVDWVYLNLMAGTTYHIETYDLAGGADTVLGLYLPGHYNSPLVSDDDSCDGYAACFDFVPSLSGRYELQITNYNGGAHWGSEVQYTLEITTH